MDRSQPAKTPYNQAELFIEHPSRLGEGPHWHKDGLIWVDILSKTVFQSRLDGSMIRLNLPAHVGAVVEWKGALLAATQAGFYPFKIETGVVGDRYSQSPILPSFMRFNDGKVDAHGRFYIGSMDYDCKEPCGKLYRLDPDGKVSVMIEDTTISNGLAWNIPRNLMYYIDTVNPQIDVFDWNPESGDLSNRRTAFSTQAHPGSPDGMCIDTKGYLWVAFWGGAQVVAFNPFNGKPMHRIEVPAPHTTSCCLGGIANDELYITSAREGLDEKQLQKYPLSGSVFRSKIPKNMPIVG